MVNHAWGPYGHGPTQSTQIATDLFLPGPRSPMTCEIRSRPRNQTGEPRLWQEQRYARQRPSSPTVMRGGHALWQGAGDNSSADRGPIFQLRFQPHDNLEGRPSTPQSGCEKNFGEGVPDPHTGYLRRNRDEQRTRSACPSTLGEQAESPTTVAGK